MNLIGAMLIMLSCTAAGIMKARSLSELDKTYGTQGAQLHKILKPFYKILVKIKTQ